MLLDFTSHLVFSVRIEPQRFGGRKGTRPQDNEKVKLTELARQENLLDTSWSFREFRLAVGPIRQFHTTLVLLDSSVKQLGVLQVSV